MTPMWVVILAAVGGLLGPVVRGQIFVHTVPAGQAWRCECPWCSARLVAGGCRHVSIALPPTGNCPRCAGRIGPPVLAVETVTAVVLSLLAWRVNGLPLLAFTWAAIVGVTLSFIDVAVHRLPDRLNLAAGGGVLGLLGVSAVTSGEFGRLGGAVACAVGVALFYLLLALVNPNGIGVGDVKTSTLVGLTAGWYGWPAAIVATSAGFMFSGLYAILLLLRRKAGRKDHMPHGPFMLTGTVLVIALAG